MRTHRNGADAPPRVLFAAVYPSSQASTRLRAEAWGPELQARGVNTEVWSFFAPGDSEAWFEGPTRPRRVRLLLRAVLRSMLLYARLHRYDLVVVLREVAPIASALFERRIVTRSRLVWDVDDAVWTPYPRMFLRRMPDRLRRSERKYVTVATLAGEVWAGSEEIAAWCREHNDQVWVLPTVPVLPEPPPPLESRSGAVWIGSHSTTDFLRSVLPFVTSTGAEVTTVGADVIEADPGQVNGLPWSETAEHDALRSARVGLYPLDLDHPLAPARAGFKAVLYMAYGLPAVVTPVPAVARLVRHGVDGLHASTPGEWRAAVRELLEDDQAWLRMSAAARRRSEQEYCTAVWAPRVANRLEALLQLGS